MIFRCLHYDALFSQAILDACCDKPVIVETVSGLIVNTQSNAIIKNSVLLSALAGIWLDAATSSSVLLALFTALQCLLRDEHPHREFNVAQLNHVRIMTALLNFCKVRSIFRTFYRLFIIGIFFFDLK